MAMDGTTRLSVAALLRQRGAGAISREDFFESLASIDGNASRHSIPADSPSPLEEVVHAFPTTPMFQQPAHEALPMPQMPMLNSLGPPQRLSQGVTSVQNRPSSHLASPLDGFEEAAAAAAAKALILEAEEAEREEAAAAAGDWAHAMVDWTPEKRRNLTAFIPSAVEAAWPQPPGLSRLEQGRHELHARGQQHTPGGWVLPSQESPRGRLRRGLDLEEAMQGEARDLLLETNEDVGRRMDELLSRRQLQVSAERHLPAGDSSVQSTPLLRRSLGAASSASALQQSFPAMPQDFAYDSGLSSPSKGSQSSRVWPGDIESRPGERSPPGSARPPTGQMQRTSATDGRSQPGVRRASSCAGNVRSSLVDFAARNEAWAQRRDKHRQTLRREHEAHLLDQCTFQPVTGCRSARRGSSPQRTRPMGNAAYHRCESADQPAANPSGGGELAVQPSKVDVQALTERLYSNSKMDKSSRFADAVQWQERRQREVLEHCTFQPDLSKSSRTFQTRAPTSAVASADASTCDVTSEHTACASASSDSGDAGPPALEPMRGCDESPRTMPSQQLAEIPGEHQEVLFQPRTNAVPCSMLNARCYLQEDVFTRLSRPHPECEQKSVGSDSMLAASPVSLQEADHPQRQPRAALALGRSYSESSLVVAHWDQGQSGRKPDAFSEFLLRQNEREESRRHRLMQLEDTYGPKHRPRLCERSLQLVQKRRQRAEQQDSDAGLRMIPGHSGAGGSSSSRQTSSTRGNKQPKDPCTFKPRLTAMAAQRDARGLEQLSLGDQKRREDKLVRAREDARQRKQKEVEKECTFSPQVNDYNGVGGRLRVLDDPDGYIERMAKFKKRELDRCAEALKQSRQAEEAEHTFRPVTHEVPGFVKGMAESYRVVRAVREQEKAAEDGDAPLRCKSEWR
eukprot:TRINITY_DN9422_c0_g3_i1.p1 TRINITY_DN9422_c0_g3~~TRINITY_DN9422_c0_g3_i1.p1  ORF type:complete len:910 (+),score=190.47 TRINITY_DN9422_c0_g3_i1:92-2821(+)